MRRPLPAAALLLLLGLPLSLAAAPVPDAARVEAERLTSIDRSPGGMTVLPTGRRITPLGAHTTVAPHPYGMALSADGRTLVATSNGTGPFALTILRGLDRPDPEVFTFSARDIPGLKSLYQGVALTADGRTLYASGGEDGRVHVFDLSARRHLAAISLDTDGWRDSISAQLALTPDGKRLLVVDQGNYRLAVLATAAGRVGARRADALCRGGGPGRAVRVRGEHRALRVPPGGEG